MIFSLKIKCFIMLDLTLALIIMIISLQFLIDFTKRYEIHAQDLKQLGNLNKAFSQILSHSDTSQENLFFKTSHLFCEGKSIKTMPPVVFENLEVTQCQKLDP